jgi:hypothetical protein
MMTSWKSLATNPVIALRLNVVLASLLLDVPRLEKLDAAGDELGVTVTVLDGVVVAVCVGVTEAATGDFVIDAVGVTDGVTEIVGVTVEVTDGVDVIVGVGVADTRLGVTVIDGVAVTVGVAVAETITGVLVTVGVGDDVTDGVVVRVGVGVTVGVGVGDDATAFSASNQTAYPPD